MTADEAWTGRMLRRRSVHVFLRSALIALAALLLGACDFWPRDLETLEQAIAERSSGDTMAWLLGGDVVVISVAGSPLYPEPQAELEAVAAEFASQAVAAVDHPLESVIITFYESAFTEDTEHQRDFIFLVMDGRPVLQPAMDFDATGPLTPEEIQAAVDRLGDTLPPEALDCVARNLPEMASRVGDPATLDRDEVDPDILEFLPVENWSLLDAIGKRLILVQALTTKAAFDCSTPKRRGPAGNAASG